MKKIVALLLVVLLALSLCACTAAATQDNTDAYAGLAPTEAAEQAAAATKDNMSLSDIIRVPFGYLLEWLYQFTSNYGLALILFSLVVKVVLLPLSIKSKKSMLKMSRLAPLAKALEAKYGDDKQKYQQELMTLYKQEGVSGAADLHAAQLALDFRGHRGLYARQRSGSRQEQLLCPARRGRPARRIHPGAERGRALRGREAARDELLVPRHRAVRHPDVAVLDL